MEGFDPLNDPRFPDRPTHPDFWKLSQLILRLDANAREGGVNVVEETLNKVVDEGAFLYFARQRSRRALALLSLDSPVEVLTAVYLEAFLMGHNYATTEPHA